MKLIIQIPCLNEEETLPDTIADLPRAVEGFDCVELMVIDDGSTDRTVEVAETLGVDHIVRMNGNQGLARAFVAGMVAAVEQGADVIVNTDADNQYDARDVDTLVAPILKREADMVIGCRPISEIKHFSPVKRLLQSLGSRVVRTISGTRVSDAPSGFRAVTADTALRLNVFSGFTYTIETIIQAGLSNLRVVSVPIRVNGPTRPSRLFQSTVGYVFRNVMTMLSAYGVYRPTTVFGLFAVLFFLAGGYLAVRWYVLTQLGIGHGHVQSVIASGVLGMCALFMFCLGVVAHLLGINRRLLEEIRYLEHSRRRETRHPGNADSAGPASSNDARELIEVGER